MSDDERLELTILRALSRAQWAVTQLAGAEVHPNAVSLRHIANGLGDAAHQLVQAADLIEARKEQR